MRCFVGALVVLGLLAVPSPGADLPRQAPELTIRLVNGQSVNLNQYRGKVVALEFLLTTCPHCQRSSQVIERMYKDYGAKGFQAVGMAINDMAHMLVPDYIKQFGITFPVGFGSRDTAINFLQHPIMLSLMMPQVVIIDRAGVIRHQFAGTDKFFEDEEKNLRAVLEPLLKETPAKKSAKSAAKR